MDDDAAMCPLMNTDRKKEKGHHCVYVFTTENIETRPTYLKAGIRLENGFKTDSIVVLLCDY